MGDFPSPRWRKSSHSPTGNADCVELADLGRAVGIRDSKDPHGPALAISRGALGSLFKDIRNS